MKKRDVDNNPYIYRTLEEEQAEIFSRSKKDSLTPKDEMNLEKEKLKNLLKNADKKKKKKKKTNAI